MPKKIITIKINNEHPGVIEKLLKLVLDKEAVENRDGMNHLYSTELSNEYLIHLLYD